MRQYLAGWSLKLTAVAAKLAFLSTAITELQDGVFSKYFIFATVAIGISRFLSASGEEQIPIELKKHPHQRLNASSSLALFCIITATINISGLFSPPTPLIAVLSLALSVAFTALAGGTIRVNNPLFYEITSNAPYILFFVFYLIFKPTTPEQLIQQLAISFFISSTAATVLYYSTKRYIAEFRPTRQGLAFLLHLYSSWRTWTGKSISSAAILLNLRYPVFVLLIFLEEESDELALALSIGEIFWQMAMIIVNRKLSSFFKNHTPPASAIVETTKGMLLTSAVGAAMVLSCGVALYFLPQFEHPELLTKLSFLQILASIFLSITFACFSFYRVACFYLESDDRSRKPANYFIVQIIIILVNSAIFLMFIETVWIAMAFGALVNTATPLFFCYRWLQREKLK